jgi:hypothetical protein
MVPRAAASCVCSVAVRQGIRTHRFCNAYGRAQLAQTQAWNVRTANTTMSLLRLAQTGSTPEHQHDVGHRIRAQSDAGGFARHRRCEICRRACDRAALRRDADSNHRHAPIFSGNEHRSTGVGLSWRDFGVHPGGRSGQRTIELQTPKGIAAAMPASLLVQKGGRVDAPTTSRAGVMAMAKTQTGPTVRSISTGVTAHSEVGGIRGTQPGFCLGWATKGHGEIPPWPLFLLTKSNRPPE